MGLRFRSCSAPYLTRLVWSRGTLQPLRKGMCAIVTERAISLRGTYRTDMAHLMEWQRSRYTHHCGDGCMSALQSPRRDARRRSGVTDLSHDGVRLKRESMPPCSIRAQAQAQAHVQTQAQHSCACYSYCRLGALPHGSQTGLAYSKSWECSHVETPLKGYADQHSCFAVYVHASVR